MKTLQIAFFVLAGALSIAAQADKTSKLVGVIYDTNGAVIPKVKVTAVGGGKTYTAVSNDEGFYVLVLPLIYNTFTAKYDITFVGPTGFKPGEFKGYVFAPGFRGMMNLDIALDVAAQRIFQPVDG